MSTLRLRYGELAEPILADRDGEVDTNWADGGTHTLTADATHAHAGTKSFKVVATAAGDFTTNYVSLASGNNGTFVEEKQYVVTIWLYSTVALGVQIKTGGVESSVFVCTANAWAASHFTFTAVTATTALQIITTTGPAGGTFWFELEPFCLCAEFTVLAERGITEPDSVEFYPPLQHEYLDGGIEDNIQAYRRKGWLDVGVVESAADRRRILYWMIDNDRKIDYETEVGLSFALADIGGYENEWKFDCSLMRYYTFALRERAVRSGDFPV